jgi:outer membrane protein assembly factor BamE
MRYPVTILLALFCAACGSYSANLPSIKPYKMDIQQGNVVTPKMLMQLRPGMSKAQVRFIMGTPLLINSFHADRWDYFYQMRKGGKIIEQRRVTLEFEGDSLARVRGDVIPAGSDTSTVAEPAKEPAQSTAKPKDKEKGWLDKLKFWGDDEDAAKAPAKAVEPAPAAKPAETAKPAAVPVPAPENVPAAEPEATSAPSESLPPLVDQAMQPKPEAVAPVETPAKPAASTPAPAPKVEVKSAASTKPAAEAKSIKPQPDAKAMTAPEPPNDLPPEDSPEFFEKMLEKIGF